MSKFKRYERYKDSGVEWIGEIPEYWEFRRISHICALGRGRVISKIEIAENEGEYPVYSSQTENNGVLGYINTYDFEGDYVTWTTDGANAGTVFRRTGRFNCTNVCGTLKPKENNLDLSYLTYALSLETKRYVRLDINPKLMNNEMAKIRVLFPPSDEQKSIANFLDQKTAEIDGLIADKEKLIELLQEKRQAIITEAVTKGLNPNVRMKDSGIEWIGEIPEHWEIRKLKYLGEAIIGLTYSPEEIADEGVLVLRASNIKNNKIVFDDNVYVNKKVPNKLITRHGDILICSRSGSRELIGKNACIDENSEGFTFGAFMTVFRSKYWRYLYYVFNSTLFKYQSGSFLTSTINQLTINNLNNFIVPLPPENEQKHICDILDKKVENIDTLITEIQNQIEKLKEYRQSLISEAVTGKIDVREFQKKNEVIFRNE